MFISRIAMKGDQAAAGPQLTPGTSSSLWRDAGKTLKKCCSIFKPSNMLCNVVFFFSFSTQRCLCACLLALLFPSIIPLGTALHAHTHTHTHNLLMCFHLAVWLLIRQTSIFKLRETETEESGTGCGSGARVVAVSSLQALEGLSLIWFFFLAWILKFISTFKSVLQQMVLKSPSNQQ